MRMVDWHGYRIAAWSLVGVLAVLAVAAGIAQGWQNSLVLGGFAVALAIYLMTQRTEQRTVQQTAPAVFNAVLAASLVVNAGGWSWGLFHRVWGYDEVAHALGTLGVTLIFGWYGYRPIMETLRRHGWVLALGIIALGIALGALWEVFEWAGFHLFSKGPVHSLNDKISDLVCDSIGAAVAVAFFRWALAQRAAPSRSD